MANVFFDIPVPTANGAGAAVDVSTMGRTKSFVIGGGFRACVNVEYALDDIGTEWAPLATFLQSGNLEIDVAAHWLRAVVTDYQSGAPNLDVGGNDAGIVMATLTGDGAAVDISTLPGFKTVVVPTGFVGTIDINEGGEGTGEWAQIFSFQTGAAAGQSREFYGQSARVTCVGAQLDVRIAGSDNGGGGGAGVVTTFTFDELGETAVTQQDQILLTDIRTVALGRKLIIQATLWSDWTNTGGGTPRARQMLRILQDPGGKGQTVLGSAAEDLPAVIPEVGPAVIGVSIAAAAEYIGDGTTQTFGLDFDGDPIPVAGDEDYVARRTTWLLIETDV